MTICFMYPVAQYVNVIASIVNTGNPMLEVVQVFAENAIITIN